jgi:hypothetical protein
VLKSNDRRASDAEAYTTYMSRCFRWQRDVVLRSNRGGRLSASYFEWDRTWKQSRSRAALKRKILSEDFQHGLVCNALGAATAQGLQQASHWSRSKKP